MFLFSGRYNRGGHFFLPSYVMRTHGARQQRETIKMTPRSQLEPVFQVSRVLYSSIFYDLFNLYRLIINFLCVLFVEFHLE